MRIVVIEHRKLSSRKCRWYEWVTYLFIVRICFLTCVQSNILRNFVARGRRMQPGALVNKQVCSKSKICLTAVVVDISQCPICALCEDIAK